MLRIALVPLVAVLAMLAATVGPLIAADRFLATREPTPAERDRLAELREAVGLDVSAVAVIEETTRSPEITVRGPPGRRVLFVTPDVLGVDGESDRDATDIDGHTLDEITVEALFAAEVARLDTYYGEFRAVSVAGVVSILAAIVLTLVPFDDGFTALLAVGLVSLWAGRRIQYAADARAADRVGADRLADAFERAADRRGVEPERGGWRTAFEVQPPLGDRIDRLRERGG
ncbi:peptidase [Halopenitus salinus]|uniref:Peptidase n=1 Tax=Halopenitus salinus TaxID=1198295 RepID=A0ABD5UWE7_9EURY